MFSRPSAPPSSGVRERWVKSVKLAMKAILHAFMTRPLSLWWQRLRRCWKPLTPVSIRGLKSTRTKPFFAWWGSVDSPTWYFLRVQDGILSKQKSCPICRWAVFEHGGERSIYVQIGDVILIVDNHTPRGHWPLGRIIQLLPEIDRVMRSVELRNSSSGLTKLIPKLFLIKSTEWCFRR